MINSKIIEMANKYYELEKIRYYQYDEKITLIDKGNDLNALIKKANKIKLRDSNNFEEKIRIYEYDKVNDEIIDYPYIRLYGDKKEYFKGVK